MPDTRSHRGAHPRDAELFGEEGTVTLRSAVTDLSWLLGRGYSVKASAALVGDRYALRARQRKALRRSAAADAEVASRDTRRVPPEALAGQTVEIDGYNVLLTVEAALGGGVLLLGCDGALRDMAAMSGHYKRVDETHRALERIGDWLADRGVETVRWLFDQPVSNSGRLAALLREHAAARALPWTVELVPDPDRILVSSDAIVASADSAILDRAGRWLNLARHVVDERVDDPWLVDFSTVAVDEPR